MVLTTCSRPGCDTAVARGYCPPCARLVAVPDDARPSARDRGYDAEWERTRAQFLDRNPTCAICRRPSEVPDHYPYSRRELVDLGVENPDAWVWLRPLCTTCHNRETARTRR